jgi:hypothetical protein
MIIWVYFYDQLSYKRSGRHNQIERLLFMIFLADILIVIWEVYWEKRIHVALINICINLPWSNVNTANIRKKEIGMRIEMCLDSVMNIKNKKSAKVKRGENVENSKRLHH